MALCRAQCFLATQKQLETDQIMSESEQWSSKCRPNFTGAEVEVLLQNVDVSILFHYGYIHAIEFSAYLFITVICSVGVVL